MKKLLLIMMVLFISSAIIAQGSKSAGGNKKSYLAFYGGPSIPSGAFKGHERNLDNSKEGGFANTGFAIDLQYGYKFHKNFTAAAVVLYNRYNLDKTALAHQWPGIKTDHWQIYGVVAGPVITFEIANKVSSGLRVMGGYASVNSPKVTYEGDLAAKEEWKGAGIFQGGIDLRVMASNTVFIYGNFDYSYLRPEFKMENPDGILITRTRQEISVMNVAVGAGLKF